MISYNTDEAVHSALDALLHSRFPQAILLQGGNAQTRNALAQHVAQALLCAQPSAPCGSCTDCVKVTHGVHPDLFLYQEDGMKVDAARALRTQASTLPNDSMRKVFVLHAANAINPQAQNALLKTLEEPPSYAFFILTCPSGEGLLETVRSRCITFLLAPAQEPTPEVEPDLAPLGAFLQALAVGDECNMLAAALSWEKLDKSAFAHMLGLLQIALRDAILHTAIEQYAHQALLPALSSATQQLYTRVPTHKLLAVYDHCDTLLQRSQFHANAALQCTVLCAGAYTICHGKSPKN